MIANEKYLSFCGSLQDAKSFVRDMREISNSTGIDFPKVMNDFLFDLSVKIEEMENEAHI